jgi:hypothetical protein
MSALEVGQVVRVEGDPTLWRVDSFFGSQVRLVPVVRWGRMVDPALVTPVEEDES